MKQLDDNALLDQVNRAVSEYNEKSSREDAIRLDDLILEAERRGILPEHLQRSLNTVREALAEAARLRIIPASA